ncbi:hypothetical protein Sjap_017182 [Stephania japonica]|uniref:Uncharacterized protein n=1 Tax=Stephania japonica TaxID=461633 RepID=A0AAP0I5Q1_9MAGN
MPGNEGIPPGNVFGIVGIGIEDRGGIVGNAVAGFGSVGLVLGNGGNVGNVGFGAVGKVDGHGN